MNCDVDKNMEFTEEILGNKRRSSILKLNDDTTKLQSQNPVFKRRVSFHNLRKVQEFDKDNGDLQKEAQEEPLHLTNISDNFKTELPMSTTFVTGSSQFNEINQTINLTLINGPQTTSTPHVNNNAEKSSIFAKSHANTTYNVFKFAEKNCELNITTQSVFIPNEDEFMEDIDDKTMIIFDKLEAADKSKDVPNNDMSFSFNAHVNDVEIKQLNSEDLKPVYLEDMEQDNMEKLELEHSEESLSESRWSQAFRNESSVHMISRKENDKINFLIDDNMDITEKKNETFKENLQEMAEETNTLWTMNGNSQMLLDEIDIHSAELLQLSNTTEPKNLTEGNIKFGESVMAQSAISIKNFSRRVLGDTANTKTIGQLAFNEPTEPSNIFTFTSADITSPAAKKPALSSPKIETNLALNLSINSTLNMEKPKLTTKKRQNFHERRRSLALIDVNSTEVIRRKSTLNSPSLIVTNSSFYKNFLEFNEEDLIKSKNFHERKQKLYNKFEAILNPSEELKKELLKLDTDIQSSYAELLTKL